MNQESAKTPKIKIFVSKHKPCIQIENRILTPIHKNDTGGDLTRYNPDYDVLYTYYWAWKNVEADYYGFMHYRRYFDFNESRFGQKLGKAESLLILSPEQTRLLDGMRK